ncbi:HAD-IB family phosphatase [Candidatus Woesearchaeota archaeon]|nr:HAD-IB family phosphatase [Candidatus Woesearchaeota archaeon]
MTKHYDLVCFDLDGTLIEDDEGDVLWERMLIRIFGNKEFSDARYEEYKTGKIKFVEWVNIDLGEWRKASMTKKDVLEEAKNTILVPGAIETLEELRKRGFKLGLISGSVDTLLDAHGLRDYFDDIFINELIYDEDDKLSSWVVNPSGDRKDVALRKICEREGIPLERTVFVGDHLNDVAACKSAGLGIAFNSRVQELKDVSNVIIQEKDLRLILKHINGEEL